MGGSSSSSSSTSTVNENYNVQGNEGIVLRGDSNVVNMTDGGAFTFAEKAVEGHVDLMGNFLGTVERLSTGQLQTMADHSKGALDIAERSTRSDQTIALQSMSKQMIWGFAALVGTVLIMNYMGSQRRA